LRTGIAVVLLCGVALSVYLINPDGALEQRNGTVGGSATASAGCPFIPLPDSFFGTDLRPFKQDLNNFCDVVGNFASNLADSVTTAITNGIGSAFHENRFCLGSRVALSPEDPDRGINSLMTRGVDFVFGVDRADSGTTTTWNQYGVAGTKWNTYFLDCWTDSRNIVNYAANLLFGFAKVFALVAILLFQQTFNNQIVDYFFVPQDGAPESAVDEIMKDLNTEIYVEFFAVAVVLGALVLLYNNVLRGQGSHSVVYKPGGIGVDGKRANADGYIKAPSRNVRGSGLSDALGKIGIMVAVAGFAALFVNYGSGYVRDANAYTNDVGEAVLAALSGTDCKNSDGESVTTTPYDCAAQTLYDALVFRLWAAGNIGELEVLGNEAETKNRRELAMRMLEQNAYSMAESAEIANPATTAERRQELLDAKQNDRTEMVKGWGARFIAKDSESATSVVDGQEINGFDPNSWRPYSHVETDRDDLWRQWSGGDTNQRVFVAGLALIASLTLGLVVISISVAYLVLQLMTVLLAMAAPGIFLIGLIPGFGYGLLLRWAEMFIGVFLKRVAMVCVIGILVAMLHIIFALALPWLMQGVLVIGVAAAGLGYRHQFSKWASSGMMGMGAAAGVATGGLAGAMSARRSLNQAREGWRSGRGLPARERVGVAGRAGYAALDRPYETEEAEYLPAAHGVSRPPPAQPSPQQATPASYRDTPARARYGPQGARRAGPGVPYRPGGKRGAGNGRPSRYAHLASSGSERPNAGYVYQPEGSSASDDGPATSGYRRERVNT
jgi:hypothetical protein